MPTIFRFGGFRVVINPIDHPPPHVHVLNADGYAVIEIETLGVRRYKGMRVADVVRAVRFVAEHSEELLEAWRKIHG